MAGRTCSSPTTRFDLDKLLSGLEDATLSKLGEQGCRQVDLTNHFQKLIGIECRDFHLVAGGSLILYFGERVDDLSKLTEWRLHIEPAWRLEGQNGPLVGSFDVCVEDQPPDWVFEAMGSIIGKSVEKITMGSPVLDLIVEMAGSYRLQTFAHSIADGENWELRHRSGLRVAMATVTSFQESIEEPDSA
jgi:hypothetical protein